MSRLYAKVSSDNGDGIATKTGHEWIMIEFYWGSREGSKLFKRIMVKWTKRMKQPKVIT